MAMDAGTNYFTFPVSGQATDAGNAVAGNVTTTGDKVFFVAPDGVDIVEVGALIGTATAPAIGGSYTVQNTVTGPAAALATGTALRRNVKIHLEKGQVLRFSVTGAPASGTAQFYAKGYPAGARSVDVISTT